MTELRRGPSGEVLLPQASQAFGAFPAVYVSVDGDDANNTGLSVGSPLRTLEAAIQMARASSVFSTIFVGPGEFDGRALSSLNVPAHGYKIVGTDFVELFPAFIVSAYTPSTVTITTASAPGWAVSQWEGAFLQWVSGATNVAPAERNKTIARNGADNISLMWPVVNVDGFAVAVGDSYRIVKPATIITSAPASSYVYQGGAMSTGVFISTGNPPTRIGLPGSVSLENLIIKGNPVVEKTVFNRGWTLTGVWFLKDHASAWQIVFSDANCEAPPYPSGSQNSKGWGVSYTNSAGVAPTMDFINSNVSLSVVGAGQLSFFGGQALILSCALRGLLYGKNSTVAFLNTSVFAFRINAGSNSSIIAENAGFLIAPSITHEGTGLLVDARYNSYVSIYREILKVGTGAGMQARMNSIIDLRYDGALLGSSTVGIGTLGTQTRPAGVWTLGEAVCTVANFTKDLSNIFRSN